MGRGRGLGKKAAERARWPENGKRKDETGLSSAGHPRGNEKKKQTSNHHQPPLSLSLDGASLLISLSLSLSLNHTPPLEKNTRGKGDEKQRGALSLSLACSSLSLCSLTLCAHLFFCSFKKRQHRLPRLLLLLLPTAAEAMAVEATAAEATVAAAAAAAGATEEAEGKVLFFFFAFAKMKGNVSLFLLARSPLLPLYFSLFLSLCLLLYL